MSSDHEIDDDEGDLEEEPDEAAETEDLRQRLLKNDFDLNMEELDTISNNIRLRDLYNYRWW